MTPRIKWCHSSVYKNYHYEKSVGVVSLGRAQGGFATDNICSGKFVS